ncbi:hypothetical protein [Chryseobacterium sp. 5_R23647]|uniref:hypothetical protein n=1 Tax=Chryseobacterium sp. 5_R23647 TaxID=2258964 RepID=UPI000E2334C5|nr:hypothetical protein [Chryseobacterium sp. 5_R23647]REC44030.1 hypothetical protein DRF69_07415 [Chryseobacterium sp. 5_R23647]
MRKSLHNINIHEKKLYLNLSLNHFCIYITFIFSFFSSFVYAQEGIGKEVSPPTIVLKQGATIFSTDASFNQQINSDRITVKNADVSNVGIQSDAKVLTAKPEKDKEVQTPKKDFKSEFKKAEENKNKETLKKVEKEISEHNDKAKKNSFNAKSLWFPTSEQFTVSEHINRDYVAPSHHNHHFSKILASQNQYVVKSALDFLHKQKYIYYNSKSLDYCFTHVFSVRPPPVLG